MKLINENANKTMNESIDSNQRINALAAGLDVDADTIKQSNYGDNCFDVDGDEYLVLTEDEAYEYAKDDIKAVWDDLGIESFTESFRDWIMDNAINSEWFEDWIREDMEAYVDDIASEDSDEFKNRLMEEMYYAKILTDADFENGRLNSNVDFDAKREEFIDYLVDDAGDPIQYFRNDFGDAEFSKTITENNLVDIDTVAEQCIDVDGVAHFIARYDGNEIELDDGLYAYRVN